MMDHEYKSEERKRKIILENYNNPEKQVSFNEIENLSKEINVPYSTLKSFESGCGDIFHLLLEIEKKEWIVKKSIFSAKDSCLITISFANIVCLYFEEKKIEELKEILEDCFKMTENKEYSSNLRNYPNLEIFNDIHKFPHRIECVKIVLRSFDSFLKNY